MCCSGLSSPFYGSVARLDSTQNARLVWSSRRTRVHKKANCRRPNLAESRDEGLKSASRAKAIPAATPGRFSLLQAGLC